MNFTLNIQKIKELSKKHGLDNLGELCEKANIHRNSITPYIKQKRSPFTQVVLDIANTLQIPATELISIEEDKFITDLKLGLAPIIKKEQAIFLFGSRARKTEKKFSDIDIGITGGKTKISFSLFSKIKSKVEDAFDNYPISVNLVNLDLAPLDFLLEIERDLTFVCGDEKTASYFLGYINGRKKN